VGVPREDEKRSKSGLPSSSSSPNCQGNRAEKHVIDMKRTRKKGGWGVKERIFFLFDYSVGDGGTHSLSLSRFSLAGKDASFNRDGTTEKIEFLCGHRICRFLLPLSLYSRSGEWTENAHLSAVLSSSSGSGGAGAGRRASGVWTAKNYAHEIEGGSERLWGPFPLLSHPTVAGFHSLARP